MTNNQVEIQDKRIKIAKKRYRVLAFLIDFFIFWLIGMIIGILYGTPNNEGGFTFNGFPAITMIALGYFLWPISEGIWGQTIGKRFLNLKVLNDNFESIGFGQAFGRFFLGFADYMFFIGLIIASNNKLNKRIGDLVANTLVVKIK